MNEKQRTTIVIIIIAVIMTFGVLLAISEGEYVLNFLYLVGILIGVIGLGSILEYKPPDDDAV